MSQFIFAVGSPLKYFRLNSTYSADDSMNNPGSGSIPSTIPAALAAGITCRNPSANRSPASSREMLVPISGPPG